MINTAFFYATFYKMVCVDSFFTSLVFDILTEFITGLVDNTVFFLCYFCKMVCVYSFFNFLVLDILTDFILGLVLI